MMAEMFVDFEFTKKSYILRTFSTLKYLVKPILIGRDETNFIF